ncbi:MAG: hypothetical protein AVDCRST_MAG27-3308, partial [uncultured Craurococcus sp.]
GDTWPSCLALGRYRDCRTAAGRGAAPGGDATLGAGRPHRRADARCDAAALHRRGCDGGAAAARRADAGGEREWDVGNRLPALPTGDTERGGAAAGHGARPARLPQPGARPVAALPPTCRGLCCNARGSASRHRPARRRIAAPEPAAHAL